MIYYQNLIEKIYRYKIDKKIALELIKNFQIDNWYVEISNLQSELQSVQRYLEESGSITQDQFTNVFAYANNLKNSIVQFYQEWYKYNSYHGDKKAYTNPDFIIVLGSNSPTSNERVQEAASWIQQNHSKAKVILSGGGFSSSQTEAQDMFKLFSEFKLSNNVLLENYAMDTIGNAWFTKNLLRQHNLLHPKIKILIITSCFHAMRSLFFFKQIYGNDFFIASYNIKTYSGDTDTIIASEMVKEYNSVKSLNIFDQKTPQDDQDILLKLFTNHDLYKNRYDLIRKFIQKSL